MSEWAGRLDEIRLRRAAALLMGGEEATLKHASRGRLTIRERIDLLVDAGSFREVGPIAGSSTLSPDGSVDFAPANFVLGLARFDKRLFVVGGEDFTISAGSPNTAGLRKSIYAEDLALRYRVPLARLHEGSGASIAGTGGQAPSLPNPVYERSRFVSIARCLSAVPVTSAALGPVAGFPAGRLAASHYAVMTRHTAQILAGGPALVERALGITIGKEELGGAEIHEASGVVDDVVDDEAEALAAMRRFLSFMPQNVWDMPLRTVTCDSPLRRCASAAAIVPGNRRRVYDMRGIVEDVLDQSSFFEIGRRFGPGQITGLGRLAGCVVGIIANDPKRSAGSLSATGAQKLRRFVDLCQTFHIPIITFVDEPGFMIGPEAEKAGTIRHGAAALTSVALSTIPWATILVRKNMGLASYAHLPSDAYVLAWPSAESGALPVEGGVAIAFRKDIAESSDPTARRLELEEKFAAFQSPFRQSEAFAIHDLIDPEETRIRLCEWIEWVQPLLRAQLGPPSFPYRP